jgi:hypothetical protein
MTKPTCINLKERFGNKYRVTHEEICAAERPEYRAAEEVWLQIIPCERGHICPWGGENLAACTTTAGPTVNRLKALPFTKVVQDGDDGANVLFHVDHFEEVAAIMHPRRRRQVSEAERARLRGVGAKYRFQPGYKADQDERPCVPTPKE